MELSFNDIASKVKSRKVLILKNLSGKFVKGQLTAVMGPSGAGKTTFFKTLCGYIDDEYLTNGNILFNKSERDIGFAKTVSYFSQEDCYDPLDSVYEHLTISALGKNRTIKKDEADVQIDCYLDKLFLTELKHVKMGYLSGGERKRVSIIAEILSDSEIIFLDEPTSGLDSNLAIQIVQLLKTIKEKIIVISIHQPSPLIIDYIDQFAFIDQGKLVYLGPVSETESFFEKNRIKKPSNVAFYEFIFLLSSTSYYSDEIEEQKNYYNVLVNSISPLDVVNSNKSRRISSAKFDFSVFYASLKIYFKKVMIRKSRKGEFPVYVRSIIDLFIELPFIGLYLYYLNSINKYKSEDLKFNGLVSSAIFLFYANNIKRNLPSNEYISNEIRKNRISFLEYILIEMILFSLFVIPSVFLISLVFCLAPFNPINFIYYFIPMTISHFFMMLIVLYYNHFITDRHLFFCMTLLHFFIRRSFLRAFFDKEERTNLTYIYPILRVISVGDSSTLFSKYLCRLFFKQVKIWDFEDSVTNRMLLCCMIILNIVIFSFGILVRYHKIVPKYRYKLVKQ